MEKRLGETTDEQDLVVAAADSAGAEELELGVASATTSAPDIAEVSLGVDDDDASVDEADSFESR